MRAAARQLDLFFAPAQAATAYGQPDSLDAADSAANPAPTEEDDERSEPPPIEPRARAYFYVDPDRSGTATYLHLFRDKADPQRAPRGPIPTPFAWRRINDASAEQWADAIVTHLADGVPRTFNRIALELTTMTADIAFQSTLDEGLWLAVAEKRLLLTLEAPVYFTLPESCRPVG